MINLLFFNPFLIIVAIRYETYLLIYKGLYIYTAHFIFVWNDVDFCVWSLTCYSDSEVLENKPKLVRQISKCVVLVPKISTNVSL